MNGVRVIVMTKIKDLIKIMYLRILQGIDKICDLIIGNDDWNKRI